jgi:hypothetical protein
VVTDILHRFDYTEAMVICAGEAQEEFVVHKGVLATSSSKFLNRMLSNDWRETREKRLRLPEAPPGPLHVYLHWLYTGNVVLGPTTTDAGTVCSVESYLLGDYLDDVTFCEAIVEGLVDLSCGPKHELPNATAVRLAWSKTNADSPIRAVIKEVFLGVAIDSTVQVLLNNDDFPYEFVLDLFAGLVEHNKSFCKRSISNKSDALIRENCKGFVRSAAEKRLSSKTNIQHAAANDA